MQVNKRRVDTPEDHRRGTIAEAASATMHATLIGAALGAFMSVDSHIKGHGIGGMRKLLRDFAARSSSSALATAALVAAFSCTRSAVLIGFGPAESIAGNASAAFAGGTAAAAVFAALPSVGLGDAFGAESTAGSSRASTARSIVQAARSSVGFGLVCSFLFVVAGARQGLPALAVSRPQGDTALEWQSKHSDEHTEAR